MRLMHAVLGAGWLALGACRAPSGSNAEPGEPPLAAAHPLPLEASADGYRVALTRAQRDYWLRAPQPGQYAIVTRTGEPVEKSKLVFDAPLAPGKYRFALSDSSACGEQTIVLSVPLSAGHYEFEVSAGGCARYDLAFHDARPTKEYRYTLHAPRAARIFRLEIPQNS